jgi:ABC-type amino acid transport substrate-binding protein
LGLGLEVATRSVLKLSVGMAIVVVGSKVVFGAWAALEVVFVAHSAAVMQPVGLAVGKGEAVGFESLLWTALSVALQTHFPAYPVQWTAL